MHVFSHGAKSLKLMFVCVHLTEDKMDDPKDA